MKFKKLLLIALVAVSFTNCFEDNDDNAIAASEINDFIWKVMNSAYLYKAEVPDLSNDRFSSDQEYANFLNESSSPESFFEQLIYDRQNVDRFSFLIPNYFEFNQSQQGTSVTNGLEFNLFLKPGSDTNVFGIIRLVLNGSEGDNLGFERGQIFDAIDGTPLTVDNFRSLLSPDTYTINFASYNDNGTPNNFDDDSIESTNNSQAISKTVYEENPVHLVSTFDVDGESVGYLVYNGFRNNESNSHFGSLNSAFGQFQAANVEHLVLDLRYNPGGRVDLAVALGSLVTGQFNGQTFSKLVYNETQQAANTSFNFTNNFDEISLNSLNLNTVYVLTTGSSASASELVINSLSEYINVVQIGTNTTGKTQASVTLYDSADFSPNNINPNHTYAIQPLVANSISANDIAVPSNGLTPDVTVEERANNYGTLGDLNEPLLAAAIIEIQGAGRFAQSTNNLKQIDTDINISANENNLVIDSDIIRE